MSEDDRIMLVRIGDSRVPVFEFKGLWQGADIKRVLAKLPRAYSELRAQRAKELTGDGTGNGANRTDKRESRATATVQRKGRTKRNEGRVSKTKGREQTDSGGSTRH